MTRSPPKRMKPMTGLKAHNPPVDGSDTPADLPPTGFPVAKSSGSLLAGEAPQKSRQRHKVGNALCGAKTRKGLPCVRRVVEGNARCPNHGGLSTGPKTAAGRARCTMNLPNVRAWIGREGRCDGD